MRAEQALACGMRKREKKASRRDAFGRGGRGLAETWPRSGGMSTAMKRVVRKAIGWLGPFSHQAGGLDKDLILHPISLLSAQPHQLIHDTPLINLLLGRH